MHFQYWKAHPGINVTETYISCVQRSTAPLPQLQHTMATFNQVYPPQFTFAPVYGHSKLSEVLVNGMESPAQYTTQSEPDSRRNSVCPQQYMDYNQQQFGHTFAPACNTFAAADNHSFAAANTFASACSTFNNNQLAANNFANQPPL
eukprot:3374866-Rhodomonas_salina.1